MNSPSPSERKWFNLSYSILATPEEAEKLYDAIQTILCTCEYHRFKKDGCRVPVSGMHPEWAGFKLEHYPDDSEDENGILVKEN